MARELKKVSRALAKASRLHKQQSETIKKYVKKNAKKKRPQSRNRKKPKGSGRRLYTDENPKDTVSIKYATVKDARETIAKVKRINKPYARKIQILTVLEQRAKFANKPEQSRLAKAAKKSLKAARKTK